MIIRKLARIGPFATVAVLSFVSCDRVKVAGFYDRGAVVSVSPIASQVGRDVFRRHGNAFDAAVAVGFALAVTFPPAGNLGGGGFAVVRDGRTREVTSLDFREQAPGLATADMYLDDSGRVIEGLATRGALAVGVPGSVAGLHALWAKYGSLPWPDLVAPAAHLADTGFMVDAQLAALFAEYASTLSGFAETEAIFRPDGSLPREGDRLIQLDLAVTLHAIANSGQDVFYGGPIADKIVACIQKHGGIISRDDLARYRPDWQSPVHFSFDSLDIYSAPPPSSGGIMVGQILKLIEPFELDHYSAASPEYIHRFCEAARLAFQDRFRWLGDPDYCDIPGNLLDDDYLDGRRGLLPLTHAGSSVEPGGTPLTTPDSGQTTHYSVCDAAGNMVAVTTTLNSMFGSGLVVDGAGFLLNNEMDDFSVAPGHANLYGLPGSEPNRIEPGKRMLSSMAPTLVLRDNRPLLILGSSGGSKIPTTVAQALLAFTRFGKTPEEIVNLPRFHHQWLPDTLYLEESGFDGTVGSRLREYGHAVARSSVIGDLKMLQIDPITGMMTGACDPRRGGAVAGL